MEKKRGLKSYRRTDTRAGFCYVAKCREGEYREKRGEKGGANFGGKQSDTGAIVRA